MVSRACRIRRGASVASTFKSIGAAAGAAVIIERTWRSVCAGAAAASVRVRHTARQACNNLMNFSCMLWLDYADTLNLKRATFNLLARASWFGRDEGGGMRDEGKTSSSSSLILHPFPIVARNF